MNAITSNFEVVKRQTADFADGTLPSWLSDTSNGGGSVTVESGIGGGRAAVSCGTQATNDKGRIESDGFSVGNFDGIYISAVLEHDANAADGGTALTKFGMEDDDASERLLHRFNDTTEGDRNMLTFGGSGDEFSPRRFLDFDNGDIFQNQIRTGLVWDAVEQRAIHRMQDCFSRSNSSYSISPSETYTTRVAIDQKDTAADRIVYVYEMEVAFLRKKNN